jgi:pentose-5-phosphate-3-epimerase
LGEIQGQPKLEAWTGFTWISWTTIFVPNISFGPDIVAIMRKLTKLPLDTHLMISNLILLSGLEASSDKIIVHIENNANILRHNELKVE